MNPIEEVLVDFWREYETEASQYDDECRSQILLSMSEEWSEDTGIPYYVLGQFVLGVH